MKKLISMILFCLLPFSVFAAYNWPKYGFNVLEQTINTANKHIELTDPDGYLLTIKYQHQYEEKQFPRIIELNKLFHSWQNIGIQNLHFNIQQNLISIIVIIDSFQQDSIDLKPAIPAGFLFTDSDHLKYNFKLVKNKVLIRIKGDYLNETELTQKIQKALSGSLSDIDQSNPKSIYHLLALKKAHIRQLNDEIRQLNKEIRQLNKEVQQLNKEVQQLKKEIRQLNKEVQQLKKEVQQLNKEVQQLKKEVQQLNDTIKQVENKNQQLKNNIKHLENKNQQLKNNIKHLENKNQQAISGQQDLKNKIVSVTHRALLEIFPDLKPVNDLEKGLEIGTVQRIVTIVYDIPGITDVEIKNILAANGISLQLEVVSKTLALIQ